MYVEYDAKVWCAYRGKQVWKHRWISEIFVALLIHQNLGMSGHYVRRGRGQRPLGRTTFVLGIECVINTCDPKDLGPLLKHVYASMAN